MLVHPATSGFTLSCIFACRLGFNPEYINLFWPSLVNFSLHTYFSSSTDSDSTRNITWTVMRSGVKSFSLSYPLYSLPYSLSSYPLSFCLSQKKSSYDINSPFGTLRSYNDTILQVFNCQRSCFFIRTGESSHVVFHAVFSIFY